MIIRARFRKSTRSDISEVLLRLSFRMDFHCRVILYEAMNRRSCVAKNLEHLDSRRLKNLVVEFIRIPDILNILNFQERVGN